jgi:hypothetical protein
MKKHALTLTLLLIYLLPFKNSAQESKVQKEQIVKAFTNYFSLERENIHVHLDKSRFLTTESIWFKGYIFNRKINRPFFSTTNIYAVLIDAEGKQLETQLLYGNLGSFSGKFALNENLPSGKYYLQFYTNWMNNFTEDESAVYEVDVTNVNAGVLQKPDYSKLNIEINPEGGSIINGIVNSIGLRISDCRHSPIPVSVVDILNAKGESIKKVQVNKLGYGRFDIAADNLQGYKVSVTLDGTVHQQAFPAAQLRGIALEINNYSIPDKILLKLKTNSQTKIQYNGKPLYMVIHQDDKAIVMDVAFDKGNEETIVLPGDELFEGINIIRLIDSDMNEIAQRIIFKYPKSVASASVQKTKVTHESIEFSAKAGYPNMNLSISVLPQNTKSLIDTNDIYGSFLISPYLDKKKAAGRYYFGQLSKAKHYELDLFLLNQKSKYDWQNILKNSPSKNAPFDMGLSIKATVNQDLNKRKINRLRVYSIAGMIDERVPINEKGEVFIDHLILPDSTKLNFSLLEDGAQKEIKLYPQVLNNSRKFNKLYKPQPEQCVFVKDEEADITDNELPLLYKNTIVLDEIEIKGTTNKLRFQKTFGNSQLRGYKISDTESRSFFYILDYIRYHGFDVTNSGTSVSIFGRTQTTINGQRTTPMIYIDNIQVLNFDVLMNIQTADVDEFYVNQHAVVSSVNNKMGIIRIYMKKNFAFREKKFQETAFTVTNGFERINRFKNIFYSSTTGKGFDNYGLVDWQPLLITDENGNFSFSIPRTLQNTVKILIEGFNAEGKLISEIKTISLE